MRKPSMRYKTAIASAPGKLNLAAILDEGLSIDLEAQDKQSALCELVALAARSPWVHDPLKLEAAILEREKALSTGIGLSVAVPHAKLASVSDKVVAIGRSHKGIDFEALDGKPVHIIVLIAIPESQSIECLNLMAWLVARLKEESVRQAILAAPDPLSICSILTGAMT